MPTTRRAKAPLAKAAASSPAAPAPAAEAAPPAAPPAAVRSLKKYPNRRLYDTETSSYITLADVKRMVLDGVDFEVRDAKTAEDLTRSILLQIILEEESGGVPMFSTQTLSQIIRFYGHAMQGVMGTMLEKNMAAFAELQARFIGQSHGLYDPKHLNPETWNAFLVGQTPVLQNLMGSYVEQSRAMFEQMQKAGSMFAPLNTMPGFKPGKK
jgi:polyhydroxyalkanoate synthesis repressor PhaR